MGKNFGTHFSPLGGGWRTALLGVMLGLVSSAAAADSALLDEMEVTEAGQLNKSVVELEGEGRYVYAIPLAERELAIYEKIRGPEHPDTARSLNNLAELYREMGAYAKAELLHRRALAIYEKVRGPEHPDTATSLNNLAWLYQAMGAYAKAEPLYQRALAIREKALGPEHRDTADTLHDLALLYQSMGAYAKAEPLYQRALAICEKTLGPEHPVTALSLINLARFYNVMGAYAKAEPLYQRALAIREKARGPEHPSTAQSLNELALVYSAMGAYAKAEPLFQRALAISEKANGPEHPDTAVALINLAGLYEAAMGAYGKAEPLLQRGLRIFEKANGPEHPDTARSLNNLALLYQAMGAYAKAEPLYQRALGILEKTRGPESLDTATTLNNLARLYTAMGAYARAESLQQRALAIFEKAAHPLTGLSLNDLAGLYTVMGAYAKAKPLYQRALAINKKALGPAHPLTGLSLNDLAGLYTAMGAYAKAEPLYQRALAIAADSRAPELLWRVQSGLSQLSAKRKRSAEAIFFGKQAVNTIQAMRGQALSLDKALQKSFLSAGAKTGVYRHLADLLIDTGRLAEAQQVLGMLKEEEYFDFVRRDADAKVESTRAGYTAEEQPWQARYQRISGQLVALGEELRALRQKEQYSETLSVQEQARLQQLDTDLDAASHAFSAMLDELKAAFAQLDKERGQAMQKRQFDVARMGMVGELGAGVVLLQYIVLEDGLRILLTTSEVQKPYKLAIGEKDINRAVETLLVALRQPALDPRPAAKTLYDALIAPLAEDLKQAQAKTLMVSLDGTLRYIPVAALYDGTHYLAEHYAVSVYTEAAADRVKDTPKPSWRIAGLGVTQAYPGFPALDGAKAELEGIVRQKDKSSGVLDGAIYLDRDFTPERLRSSLSPAYPVLHVASHFKFNPTDADSFLLLGDGTHLSLAELRKGRYDFKYVDLLTLSACETALGSGREVEGLAVTAQNKGAKGVLATLWPVADKTTAVLMQRMYALRETERLSKAEALRRAQLELLQGQVEVPETEAERKGSSGERKEQPQAAQAPPYTPDPERPYAHPYYWAPFILMGNWL